MYRDQGQQWKKFHSITWLEHMEIDGGGNFKGKKKGFIAWVLKLPGIAVITWEHCPIHRYAYFVIFLYLFLYFFFVPECSWV